LSTVEIADRVLVMEAGRIIEDGTPDELISGTGKFAQLHQAWRDSLVGSIRPVQQCMLGSAGWSDTTRSADGCRYRRPATTDHRLCHRPRAYGGPVDRRAHQPAVHRFGTVVGRHPRPRCHDLRASPPGDAAVPAEERCPSEHLVPAGGRNDISVVSW